MPKVINDGVSVYEAAYQRIYDHYAAGDTVVCSISGGKDSTICMELCIQVARELGKLPILAQTRDEEIMAPGTYEYLERVYQRQDEVHLDWHIAGQPIINSFHRYMPYWWVFDPAEESKWVRRPPDFAKWVDTQLIDGLVSKDRYPTDNKLVAVIGLRTQESLVRMTRISSTEGALTKRPTSFGAYTLAPIYDWTDEDVWKFIKDFHLDYNTAYNDMYRIGVPRTKLRIAPPTMVQGLDTLSYLARLYPQWYEKVEQRVPGMRLAANYGRRVMIPLRRENETWEQVVYRIKDEAIEAGVTWLPPRIDAAVKWAIRRHKGHSSGEFPMTTKHRCIQCPPRNPGSWQGLAMSLYNGDPWATKNQYLDYLDHCALREDAKSWYVDGKKGKIYW